MEYMLSNKSVRDALCQVDVSEEEEDFQGVVTACLNVLLLGIETRLDAGLQAMVRVNWSAVEAVSNHLPSP